jgi:alpha-beta hydrolase superfamily lysophospholipase
MISHLTRLAVQCVFVIVIIVFTIVLVRAFDSRSLPDLKTWHRTVLESEFSVATGDQISGFEEYLELEESLFTELHNKINEKLPPGEKLPLSRYTTGSPVNPEKYTRNWNRSFELTPENLRGGVLLLHGLTDSPYSMRHLADLFMAQGFYVLCPRMPGHGTIPGALINTTWHDWMAVVRMGARHVRSKTGNNLPFYLVGYSNGGALSIKYINESLENENLPKPKHVFLLSPMLGVTFFARFSDWHKIFSWIPYFEKFRWLDIYPEYDPFKYNSFPKAAGEQTFLLTREISKELDHLARSGKISGLPPLLTFQSLVDATVLTQAIVDNLYNKLSPDNNELVFFDVNRLSEVDSFFQEKHDQLLHKLIEIDELPYTLTILTNATSETRSVVIKSKKPHSGIGPARPSTMEWPQKVYSLSHVAIPFPDDDQLYGPMGSVIYNNVNIGTFSPRGEKGILNVPTDLLMRLRYNPFYDYMKVRILESISTK